MPARAGAPPAPLHPGFWADVSAYAVLAVAGNVLLMQAVRLADLSVLGPLNAYKAVVSLVPGAVLLSEVPAGAGTRPGSSSNKPDQPHVASTTAGGSQAHVALALPVPDQQQFRQRLRPQSARPPTNSVASRVLGRG